MTGTGISEGQDLQEIPQETKEEMGARTSTSTPVNDDRESRLSLAQLKYLANIWMGTYKDHVLNYNFSDDLLSGEVTTEWSEVEATKEEYPSTTKNQDIVEDPDADITKV